MMATGQPVGQLCRECGSSNVVEDDLYSQPQWVCADCGSVLAEGRLTTDRTEENQGTNVQYYKSTAVDKQPCYNQIKGLKRVRALCRILHFSPVVEELAESLFSQAYEHPSFLYVHQHKKELLAGCSVLLSCRLNGWPIVMGTVASLLEADSCLMGTVFQDLVKCLNVELSMVGISELLEGHCSSYHLSPSEVPEEYCENPSRLVERAAELLELASETWVVTGRHPVPVLVASVYLAWLSLKPCSARMRLSLGRFCKMAKVSVPGPAHRRLAELKEVLCKLGKELPWQRGVEVEPQNVFTIVEDILKYRLTLLRLALRTHEESLAVKNAPAGNVLPAGNENPPDGCSSNTLGLPTGPSSYTENPPSGHTSSSEGLPAGSTPCPERPLSGFMSSTERPPNGPSKVLANDHTPRTKYPSSSSASHIEALPLSDLSCVSQLEEEPKASLASEAELWWKRLVFVPPCMKNPLKRARTTERGPDVTGDEEISDSEIEGYLRTPQEVKEFAEMQKKLRCKN
ncbi:transcription factor IIIB 50 kDa subunit [Scleropages formosus]|nr:transcription factor IIIB 50 kDa subunit [Scleropages formosus]XP_018589932.1 transcription factor IIIB 50 kDa subunit [Scleropages formosus]